jgi:hypothetical protein
MFGKKKPGIEELLKQASVNSKISCLKVFEIIEKHSLPKDEAGMILNNAKIKISACQLGLFGYQGGKNIPNVENVPEMLEKRIKSGIENGKLACATAWEIAADLNLKKMDVSSACEKLGIKISRCQLKAF